MRVRVLLAAFLPVLLAGCFEDPVTETLVIQMAPEDRAVVTANVRLAGGSKEKALARRLAQLNADFLSGHDLWTRRFERLDFEHEERAITRDRVEPPKGERRGPPEYTISQVNHSIVIPRDELPFLMSDSGVVFRALREAGRGEVLVIPGEGTLSTEEQRRVLRDHLSGWSAQAAVYLSEAARLYAYLERSPERAEPVFGALFHDLVEDAWEEANPLLDDEEEIVERVRKAMEAMAEELQGLQEIPYGLNELSYLVYDPLPAAITVCLPGPAEVAEGFVPTGELCWAIPRRGILEAFEAMDGRWIAPDPFVTWIGVHRSFGSETLDLPGFAAQPREIRQLASAGAIVKELETRMRHEPAYRLEWIEREPDEELHRERSR